MTETSERKTRSKKKYSERGAVASNALKQLKNRESIALPLIPLRSLVSLPKLTLTFEITREVSKEALKAAMASNRMLLLAPQLDPDIEEPTPNHIAPVACLCMVQEVMESPRNEQLRVCVEGLIRFELTACLSRQPYFLYQGSPLIDTYRTPDEQIEAEACRRLLLRRYQELDDAYTRTGGEMTLPLLKLNDPADVADVIASNLELDFDEQCRFLFEKNIVTRLYDLLIMLEREKRLVSYENDLEFKVRKSISEGQREYYLREQLKVIHEELGDNKKVDGDIKRYVDRLNKIELPDDDWERLKKQIKKLAQYPSNMPDAAILRNYLDLVFDLPWGRMVPEKLNLQRARRQLNADHYGLEKVKERLLEYLAVRARQIHKNVDNYKSPILCLVGPPGVGKTSVAASIAKALGRPYIRMSLGGVRDEADIRGHRRTYVGAMPGRVISAMRQAKADNPLILLDEVDKLGSDYRGDPASALLEVLDPEQNKAFHDHYLEVSYDLSHVLFLTTANNAEDIPLALLDRMELIELNGYTEEEKYHIAKLHLWPKQMEANAVKRSEARISKSALISVIRGYTREAGVRQLEQKLAKICRGVALQLSENEAATGQPRAEAATGEAVAKAADQSGAAAKSSEQPDLQLGALKLPIRIGPKELAAYLGKPRYHYDSADKINCVGQATGLAWTSAGGEALTIEAVVIPGKGKLELTGQLGQVMQESAKVALAYIRSKSELLKIDPDFFSKKDINIHVPEGAIPKDGPSAGITLATALYSALSGIPVRADLAMTGEITIRGRVLPIGGLKEKLIAAHRMGIREVLIPADNKADIEDVPISVRGALNIHPVMNADQVLKFALCTENHQEKGVE